MSRILTLLAVLLVATAVTCAAEVGGPALAADIALLSVKTFGAVGDGKADDTAAIQQALDSAGMPNPSTPGTTYPNIVFFPAGVYRVTKTLQMHHKQRAAQLLGTGANCNVGTRFGHSTLQWDGAAGEPLLNVAGYLGLRIGELLFDGNKKAGVLVRINSIKGLGTGLWYFERVNFIHADTGIECGADMDACASDMTFVDCNFSRLTSAGFRTMAGQNVDYVFIRCIATWVPIGFHFKKGGVGHWILPAFGRVRRGIKIDQGGVNCGVYTMTGLQVENFNYDSEEKRLTVIEASGGVHFSVTGIYTGATNIWGDKGDVDTPIFILGAGTRVSVRDSNLTGRVATLTGSKGWGPTWMTFESCSFSLACDPREDITVDDFSGFVLRDCCLGIDNITKNKPVRTPGTFFIEEYRRAVKAFPVIKDPGTPAPAIPAPPPPPLPPAVPPAN